MASTTLVWVNGLGRGRRARVLTRAPFAHARSLPASRQVQLLWCGPVQARGSDMQVLSGGAAFAGRASVEASLSIAPLLATFRRKIAASNRCGWLSAAGTARADRLAHRAHRVPP